MDHAFVDSIHTLSLVHLATEPDSVEHPINTGLCCVQLLLLFLLLDLVLDLRILWLPALFSIGTLSPSSVRVQQAFLFWHLGSFLLQDFLVSILIKMAVDNWHLAHRGNLRFDRIPAIVLSPFFPKGLI